MRLIFVIVSAALAAVAAWFGQPYVHHNADFVVIVVTVFAVFAGFLIAIITILGDPSMIPDGSWRIAESRRENIERRLITHVYFFILYLITIGFLFAGVIIQGAYAEHDAIRVWVERLYLFFGVFSFILSFALPVGLMRLQRARVDAEIERRRQQEGIGAGSMSADTTAH
jgi:MFS family permease